MAVYIYIGKCSKLSELMNANSNSKAMINSLNELCRIWGVGPVKARHLYNLGKLLVG